MDELITWLRAALDDDERVARKANDLRPGPWAIRFDRFDQAEIYSAPREAERGRDSTVLDIGSIDHVCDDHIARWDPARVLAEVEAKRQVLDLHGESDECDAHDAAYETIPCDTLLALAQPYAGQPGWREEWSTTHSDHS